MLATQRRVLSSTHNQALSAQLFCAEGKVLPAGPCTSAFGQQPAIPGGGRKVFLGTIATPLELRASLGIAHP